MEVKFDIDANGILSVTATDKGSGRKQDIRITGASTLAKDDVQRMVSEADKYAAEDKKRCAPGKPEGLQCSCLRRLTVQGLASTRNFLQGQPHTAL